MLWWLAQVGLETRTFAGISWARNSKPTLKDPVPESVWTVTILPAWIAEEFSPKISLWEWVLKPAKPSIGKYS